MRNFLGASFVAGEIWLSSGKVCELCFLFFVAGKKRTDRTTDSEIWPSKVILVILANNGDAKTPSQQKDFGLPKRDKDFG